MKIMITDVERVHSYATAELAMNLMNRYFVEYDIPAIASLKNSGVEIDTNLGKSEIEKVYAVMDGVFHTLKKIKSQ